MGARNPIAAVTVNRTINGSDVQLRGIYRRNGDVFILEEQWKVDKNTRVNGRCEQCLGVGSLTGGQSRRCVLASVVLGGCDEPCYCFDQ